jgi:hypothetical protein
MSRTVARCRPLLQGVAGSKRVSAAPSAGRAVVEARPQPGWMRGARWTRQVDNQQNDRTDGRGVGVNPSRRDWRLVAAVVVVVLALVVVGRVQGQNLGAGGAGVSRATSATVATDDTPVASGLAVAARVALPGQPVAVAAGEGAVWVLLEQGTVLRVDPDRHRVTGRVELGASAGGGPVGPLAVGAGAVWVGTREGTVTARVDPERLRVTAWLRGHVAVVAHGVLWSWCCPRGDKAMGFGRRDAGTLRPRPPLVVTDAAGRRQPVGRLAVGADAVWTQTPEDQRLWRVPLAGGPARAVVRVPGTGYGLAGGAGAVWVLSGTGDPGSERDWTGRLRRLDQRTGEVTATTPLPDLAPGRVVGPVVGGGAVWLGGPYARGCCGILVRVDADSGRVAGWLRDPRWFFQDLVRIDADSGRAAGWLRDPRWFFQDVVAGGPRGAWVATAAPELLHVVAA